MQASKSLAFVYGRDALNTGDLHRNAGALPIF